MKEMKLRGRSTIRKDIGQVQDKLRDCLEAEASMQKLIGQISEGNTRAQAMQRIMMFVPCIMHCESRVGIKNLTTILI